MKKCSVLDAGAVDITALARLAWATQHSSSCIGPALCMESAAVVYFRMYCMMQNVKPVPEEPHVTSGLYSYY